MSCRPTQEGKNFTKYPVSHPSDGNRVGGERMNQGWAQEYKVKTAIVTIRVCSFPQEPVPRRDSWWDVSCSYCRLSHENPLSDPVPPCGLWQMVASNWTLTKQSKKSQWHRQYWWCWSVIHSQHSCYKNCSKNKKYICDCLWLLQIKIMQ